MYHLDRLSFQALLERISAGAWTPRGRRAVLNSMPAGSLHEVRSIQEIGAEVARVLEGEERLPLGELPEVDSLLDRLGTPGTLLDGPELWDIRVVFELLSRMGSFLAGSGARRLQHFIAKHGPISRYQDEVAALDAALHPGGEVRDDATPELRRLRSQLRQQENRIRELASSIAERWYREGIAQEAEPVLREGRLVISVKAEARGRVTGLALDRSRSGQTFFIEPAELSDAALEAKETRRDEAQEVQRILASLSGLCTERVAETGADLDRLAILDSAQAASRYSEAGRTALPEVGEGGDLVLQEARHPLLAAAHGADRVVPLTLTLPEDRRTLVISGPNSGGKTVALQTVGLCAALAMCGFPIPAAEGSHLPFVDAVLADIGDEQSLEADLSTFTAHLKRMRSMVDSDSGAALCLIDEAGAGTDPAQGAALSIAVLEELTRRNAWVVCTTHNGRIKEHASSADGMANGRMVFSGTSLTPTYEFVAGEPGRSFAFEIAERSGLRGDLVERARELLDPRERRLEELHAETEEARSRLADLEREAGIDRRKAEAARVEYETLHSELRAEERQLRKAARQEAADLVAAARREIERTVKDLREKQASPAVVKRAHRTLEKLEEAVAVEHAEPEREPPKRPLRVGDRVYVTPLEREATVEAIEGRRLRVRTEGLSVEMAAGDVRLVGEAGSDPGAEACGPQSRRCLSGWISSAAGPRRPGICWTSTWMTRCWPGCRRRRSSTAWAGVCCVAWWPRCWPTIPRLRRSNSTGRLPGETV